jgi:hypothetical protein
MKLRNLLITGFSFALLAIPSFGQSAATIQQRKVDQQDRIAQGVRSGQLTPRETSHLEHQQQSINREEHAMRRADGGRLTAADREALTRRQNRASEHIYADKHNARRA